MKKARKFACCLTTGVQVVVHSSASADGDVFWLGGEWNQQTSWNVGIVPLGADHLQILWDGDDDTVLLYEPLLIESSWYAHFDDFSINAPGAGKVTLLQEEHPAGFDAGNEIFNLGPSELSVNNLHIGPFGWGEYHLTGGVLRIQRELTIGREGIPGGQDQDAFGLLRISGNGHLAADENGDGIWEVGKRHDGKIIQTGGHVDALHELEENATQFEGQAKYILVVGGQTASGYNAVGSYELSDGLLEIGDIRVGWIGNGTFSQTGGVVNTGKLFVGRQSAGSSGSYQLNGGTLNATFHPEGTVVGLDDATGLFTHDAGTHNASQVAVLNDGRYDFRGGAINAPVSVTGAGEFDQQGGTLSGSINLLGGTYTFSAGDIIGSNLWISSNGFFTHSGGPLSLSATTVTGLRLNSGQYLLQGTGDLDVTGDSIVGDAGQAIFTQSGGQAAFSGNLTIGEQAGGDGTFSFTGGNLDLGNLTIGNEGEGIFSQSQTTLTGVGQLMLGKEATGDGTWLGTFDAQLGATSAEIGGAGMGLFDQASGSSTFGGLVTLGVGTTGDGTLKVAPDASFQANGLTVGDSGNGVLDLDGGTLTVTQAATLGGSVEGTGQVVQDGGTLSSAASIIGLTGQGIYNQNTGIHETSTLTLGVNPDAQGSYSYLGGSLVVENEVVVGRSGIGSFTQGIPESISGPVLALDEVLEIGDEADSVGNYLLHAGALTAPGVVVGGFGDGSFVQQGGQVILAGPLEIAKETGSSGLVSLQDGTFDAPQMDVGGILELDGAVADSTGSVTVPNRAGAKLRMLSGSLTAGSLTVGNAVTGLDLQGGTLTVQSDIEFGLLAGDVIGPVNLLFPVTFDVQGTATVENFSSLDVAHPGARFEATQLDVMPGGSAGISDGTLDAGAMGIEDGGTFSQTGGAMTVAENLEVVSDGDGAFAIGGGTLEVGADLIFTETSGSAGGNEVDGSADVTVTGDFQVKSAGSSSTDSATFRQRGSSQIEVGGMLELGLAFHEFNLEDSYYLRDAAVLETAGTVIGEAEFWQYAGTNHTVDGSLAVGVDGKDGTYQLRGGNAQAGALRIGDGISTSGLFRQNDGTLQLDSDLLIGSDFFATGSFRKFDGTTTAASMTVGAHPSASSATFHQTGGLTTFTGSIVNHQTLIHTGGNLSASELINHGSATLGGPLTADVSNSGAMGMAGLSDLALIGDFEQTGTGLITLKVEGGPGDGSDWQAVLATGAVTLSGTLEVAFNTTAGFVPEVDDSWTLISGTSVTGVFDSLVVNAPGLRDGMELVIEYQPNEVRLVVQPTIPTKTYPEWVAEHALTGADAEIDADPDADGLVNLIEFVLGTDPDHFETSPIRVEPVEGHLELSFDKPDYEPAGVEYRGRFSTDLILWQDAQVVTDDDLEYVVRIPQGVGSLPRAFMLLLVEESPPAGS